MLDTFRSGSALQTAFVQIIWHLSKIFFGPVAGVLADRWDRKRIIVVINFLSAIVIGTVAAIIFFQRSPSIVIAFVAVFLLNTLTTFLGPAQFSIMPTVISRELLISASGMFSTAKQLAALLGSALAGVVTATVGAAWALGVDALSFLLAALIMTAVPIPVTNTLLSSVEKRLEKRKSFFKEIVDGWQATANAPIVRTLLWLVMLINISSFIGPLFPALVDQQLQGNAAVYGTLEAMGIIGGLTGGFLTGILDRRFGAGRLLSIGWALAGMCGLGMAISTSIPLTAVLEALLAFGLTMSGISSGALMQAMSPEGYRGRIGGILIALSIITIPPSTFLGGWLADILGPAPLFAFSGVWSLCIASLAWLTPHIRTAHL